MKGADRIILVALPLLAVAAGFWLLVLAPKNKEAGELATRIDSLQASIAASESQIATSEQARSAFPENYADLVSLGTAVPEDDDQATLIQDLTGLAQSDSVIFQGFELVPGSGAAAAAPAAAPADPSQPAPGAAGTATTVSAPATEASAAALPIGATVGPAGLPVTPYDLHYRGPFFGMADLFKSLDDTVEVGANPASTKAPVTHGRLITIDGFSMTEDKKSGFPRVATDLSVTTYLVPSGQGISAGATPAGPDTVGSDAPAITGTPAASPAPTTAAVTP